jgi:hypothetical protein
MTQNAGLGAASIAIVLLELAGLAQAIRLAFFDPEFYALITDGSWIPVGLWVVVGVSLILKSFFILRLATPTMKDVVLAFAWSTGITLVLLIAWSSALVPDMVVLIAAVAIAAVYGFRSPTQSMIALIFALNGLFVLQINYLEGLSHT